MSSFIVCRGTIGPTWESRVFMESWSRQLSNDAKVSPRLGRIVSIVASVVYSALYVLNAKETLAWGEIEDNGIQKPLASYNMLREGNAFWEFSEPDFPFAVRRYRLTRSGDAENACQKRKTTTNVTKRSVVHVSCVASSRTWPVNDIIGLWFLYSRMLRYAYCCTPAGLRSERLILFVYKFRAPCEKKGLKKIGTRMSSSLVIRCHLCKSRVALPKIINKDRRVREFWEYMLNIHQTPSNETGHARSNFRCLWIHKSPAITNRNKRYSIFCHRARRSEIKVSNLFLDVGISITSSQCLSYIIVCYIPVFKQVQKDGLSVWEIPW